jgi:Ni/Co efflux regulator RcnB
MKKTISSILIVSAIAGIPTLALADNNRQKNEDKKIKIEFRHENKDSKEDRDHKRATSTIVKVAKIESSRITTYTDVSTILTGLATTTQGLKLSATTTASTTLSTSELALFAKLNPKGTKAENINLRADQTLAQISALQALVSPLGNQTVTTSFGLKDLIVRELNRIVSQVNSLAKLSATIK